MTDSGTYSLWLEPSGNIATKLQEQIRTLSAKNGTPSFSPHVTLLGGITSLETEAVSNIKKLALPVQSLDLELTETSYCNRFYQSLFVHIAETNQLLELRNKALELFNITDAEEYMPHLSLLYGNLSQKEKEGILDEIGREFYTPFTVKNMVLVKTDGKPDQWRRIHTDVLSQF